MHNSNGLGWCAGGQAVPISKGSAVYVALSCEDRAVAVQRGARQGQVPAGPGDACQAVSNCYLISLTFNWHLIWRHWEAWSISSASYTCTNGVLHSDSFGNVMCTYDMIHGCVA